MKEFENNAYFWQKVDTLYSSGDFKLLNKKGSAHKNYPSLTYPCDYGFVETLSGESDAPMEVFKSSQGNTVDALVLCADIMLFFEICLQGVAQGGVALAHAVLQYADGVLTEQPL